MKKHLLIALPVLALGSLWPPPVMAGTLSDSDLLAMQVTMQSYIESSLVNGALLSVDAKSGGVLEYFPTKAHPKVMSLGENFIMCAEVVDHEGKASMADFYLAKSNDQFVVFQSVIGHDPFLERMMLEGRVAAVN